MFSAAFPPLQSELEWISAVLHWEWHLLLAAVSYTPHFKKRKQFIEANTATDELSMRLLQIQMMKEFFGWSDF